MAPFRRMGRSILLVVIFVIVTPLTIGTSVFTLLTLNPPSQNINAISKTPGAQVFASLPANAPAINLEVKAADARPLIIEKYLELYKSPLYPYAKYIVDVSDKYEIDWRLLPAIAQQESNLCKWIPVGSHNCWGWGIHKEGTLGFDTFEEAIDAVAIGLRNEYLDKGLLTPQEIMSKYTPHSNGSWAEGVTQFMGELQ